MEGNSEEVHDRRRTGVNRVVMTNGNGGKLDVYTATASRIRVWLGCIIAALTVIGMVFAAARIGVGVEIHKAIDDECDPPSGVIYKEIESRSNEFLEEVKGVLQDDLDVFDGRFEEQTAEIQKQHDLGIRLEERQIAMEKKADADKAELIREIRRAGGE